MQGERIGSIVGEVLADVDEDGLGWGKYLRVRIIMDITKPLVRGKMVRVDGILRWIEFKHADMNCGITKTRRNTVRNEIAQYGQWLRASPVITNGFEDKMYGVSVKVQADRTQRTGMIDHNKTDDIILVEKNFINRNLSNNQATKTRTSNKGKHILQIELQSNLDENETNQFVELEQTKIA